ncbi:anthocyanin 3'-O-beta-glucosyltransferase [Beta vulgaris subsp. vulgaris]|uniref:anthocyanin 3'-O-beta-glucosyltransferase n=1 Tax=Beta vulgaris subsp. vulgaris TaxID=3555 RepID=UPI0020374A84|nr:anthocyanin 3'-O-beta-glucosyltransferase [Beta vulgaris subsp. vulgaris]
MESKAVANGSTKSKLTAYFLPYLTPSHYIPLFQIAKLFASRGVHVIFLSTPHNALSFRDTIDSLNKLGLHIDLEYVDFPSKEVGLPEGVENFSTATNLDVAGKVFRAFFMLQGPMEAKVRAAKPDFVVADMHCFWATELAAELGIPRLIYHVRAFFALAAVDAIARLAPHEGIQSDEEPFLIPGLPHPIYMTRSELPQWIQTPSPYTTFANKVTEGDRNCYGALVDSFYDLEKDYIEYYRNTLGRRAWCLGPLFLHHDVVLGKLNPNINQESNEVEQEKKHPCLEWLDTMPKGKVVYVSFGTLSRFSSAQLFEIASALESSGHPFIWVVRKKEETGEEGDKWLPEGFEERITQKRIGVLMAWAPQAKILEHPATGGFMTHCGWNSSMEAITAGLPVVAWPLSAEQFYHRRLFIDVLKTGVGVGNMKWSSMIDGTDELVERGNIENGLRELMGDHEEAEERRRRANKFGIAAKKAVEEGGSSYDDLTSVIEDIQRLKLSNVAT